jgi:hypothetical protein
MTTVTPHTEQLLDQASERQQLTDYGDLPFREGIDVLLWSLEHESGNPPERVAQIAASLVLPALISGCGWWTTASAIPRSRRRR